MVCATPIPGSNYTTDSVFSCIDTNVGDALTVAGLLVGLILIGLVLRAMGGRR